MNFNARRHSEGWGNKKGRDNEKDWDNAAKFEATHKMAVLNWRGKYSYPSWAALSNFLKSRVGLYWNDVWREICKWADERSHNGWKIRQSILDQVEFTHVAENGKIYYTDSKRYLNNELVELRADTFYVNDSGVLLRYRKKKKDEVKYKVGDVERFISSKSEFRRYDGVWFEIGQSKEFPYKDRWGVWHYPHIDSRFKKWWWCGKYITARNKKIFLDYLNDDGKKITTRSLNKKEIRKLLKQVEECIDGGFTTNPY